MMKNLRRLMLLLLVCATIAAPASAEESDPLESFRDGQWSVGAGMGFAANPVSTFLISLEAPYRLSGDGWLGRLSIGPVMDFSVENYYLLLLFYGNAKLHWGLDELIEGSKIAKDIDLFAQTGFGLSHLEIDLSSASYGGFGGFRGRGARYDKQGVLWNFGFGLDYSVTENITLTSSMAFNIVGPHLLPSNFAYTWKMIGARYAF